MQLGKFDLQLLPQLTLQGSPTGANIIPITPEGIGQMLEYNLKFAKDKARVLYLFEKGVYRPVGDDIHVACIEFYQQFNQRWSTNKDSQVMDYLTKRADELLEEPLPDRINFRNGLYFIQENRFESHEEIDHSSYKTLIQIPVDYNPEATCPNIDRFLQDIFPEGYQLLYDVIGICMTSVTSQAMAVILLGGGCNGKSIYLHGLRSLIGFNNVSTTPMHTLADTKDRFANNDLVHKLVNCGDDTQMEKILETANIKSIISGNPIRVEGKFKTATSYKPFCKLVFASNHRLSANDDTIGYSRRIMHIPLSRTFAKDPVKERELLSLFDDPTERSGAVNEILKRLKITCNRGFQIPEAADELVSNYDPIPIEAEEFLKSILVEDLDGKIPLNEFMTAYYLNSERDDSRMQVIRYIKQLFPMMIKGRPRYDGVQRTSLMGIKVVDAEMIEIMNLRVLPQSKTEDED